MPITPTFPGVYLEEIASGSHTVTPLATSIAAFVGRAPIGPVEEALTIFSFGDFIRSYGGLSLNYPMSYAVQDFFENGGSQAIIARLFEPADGQGNGYAQLAFPPSPPMLPDGWQLCKPASVGDNTLAVQEPTGGSEGSPSLGMQFYLNRDKSQAYLVTQFTDAKDKTPASISIVPALQGPSKRSFPICTPLDFSNGPSPSGWTYVSGSGTTMNLSGGSGIPDIGESLTLPNDSRTYSIVDEPTVAMTAGGLQLKINIAPKPAGSIFYGAGVEFAPPQPSPMPLLWQIDSFSDGGAKPSTLALVRGTGAPLPGDVFTVGSNPTLFTVRGFTAAVPEKNQFAQLSFVATVDGTMPFDPKAFCFCCTLRFTRPVPVGWSIKKAPKAGDFKFTVGSSIGSTGVIDVGHTFEVTNSGKVYNVRLYNAATGEITFLPEADSDFASATDVSFAPPLQLIAASPGSWGNRLYAQADDNGITDAAARQFAHFDLAREDLFNLTLTLSDVRGRQLSQERYLNCTVKSTGLAKDFPNRLDLVLKGSNLCQVSQLPNSPPVGGAVMGKGGDDGDYLEPETYLGDPLKNKGIYLLNTVPMFNLLCIPPDRRLSDDVPLPMQDLDPLVRQFAATYCTDKRAVYIVDPPAAWEALAAEGRIGDIKLEDLGITGENEAGIEVGRNAAVYFPRFVGEDILMKGRPATFAACGAIAGVIAATDVGRGVWKAPAGMDAGVAGVSRLTVSLTDQQQGVLNPLGINCLRTFPVIGTVVWGARTLRGADQFEDDYKYLPVRRLTLFIEDSLYRATQWAVFEPNAESLWSSLRLSVNAFLADLARQGAFYNYTVACDASTTTPSDIANGIVNIYVGIAPVKPAEFVMIQIQQTAATSAS